MAIAIRQDVYIGGEWIPGDGEEIEVTSPATGELLGTVAASTPAQVDAAVRAAADAFPVWRKVSLLERVELCRAAFAICMERADEIAEMITREVGKTIRESREEMVEYTADHFRRASEDVLRQAGQVLPSTQERSNAKRIIVTQERGDPDRLRAGDRLHGGLEAVGAGAALREHVRRGHPRRRLPGGDAERRARPRRRRLAARAPS